jgi:DNA-binding response OmpR family regulator
MAEAWNSWSTPGGGGQCVLKVLIVDDDLMIADMIEEILIEGGYEVCGIARTVTEAVTLGRSHTPDLAVIDLRLADGGLGTEIATQLAAISGLGILYATGNISGVMSGGAAGHACIIKPYSAADLLDSLKIVAEMVANGTASPPYPRGFQVLPSAITAPREAQRG